MSDFQLPRLPKGRVHKCYTQIVQGEPDRFGNNVALAVAVDRRDNRTYAVVFNSREGYGDGFDDIAEFPATDEGRIAAEIAMKIAARTLVQADRAHDPVE